MRCIRFGPFELNSQTYELRKGGKQAKIQQQPARVLALLASAPGTLITREQIRAAIWGAETFVDFEQSLNFCIRQIRLILDDSASHPVLIETLPRLGYRFIAPVEQTTERPTIAGRPRSRIGVLPMDEMGASVDDYFAQGLTEDLISALSRVNPERLRVVSGPRLGTDNPTLAELEQVGRDLHLDYLLRGWVRRSPGAIRVCTQLHDLHDKSVLWSETYDRSAADLSALQEEVTRRVSRSLAFELLPASSTGPRKYARSPAAYDSYLKGRYFWHKMTREAMESSIHYFRDAIALDPSFAPAYAGLADCYAQMGSMNLSLNKLAAPLGVVLLAGLLPSFAHAACAGAAPRLQPNSWHQQTGQVRLLPASLAGAPDQDDNVASIVGLWHFKFEVGSTVVDAGFQQWHSDGTELENSAIHAPNTTNFCMGVWEQVGRRQYKLNHFALNWDPTIGPGVVPAGALAGTVHIQGLVTIAPDGQTFTGTFKILFYPAGSTKPDPNSYTAGTYTGTRVNVDTPAAAVL